ncbi:MAG TPA: hypothetical protein VEK13_01125 [Thermoplasmata archaeon]|nr:hypothetical protein [Thermoplasmata archaeon]
MRSYIDLYFAPDSLAPTEVRDRVREGTGLSFIRGPHDLMFDWTTEEEFRGKLLKVHDALKGTGVFYRVETVPNDSGAVEPVPWPALPRADRTRHY